MEYTPTTDDLVYILCTYCKHVPPKNQVKLYKLENGKTVHVNMHAFMLSISPNWRR